MSELVAVILAAGKGTRMKSKLPKVLHKIGGKPMLQHVLDAADAAGAARKVVVVGHEAELVEAMVGEQAQMALQAEQRYWTCSDADGSCFKRFLRYGNDYLRRYAVIRSSRA